MTKMTLQQLKDLYPKYEHIPNRAKSATRKGYKHNHKPAWKPARPEMTPAQWMRANRAKNKKH